MRSCLIGIGMIAAFAAFVESSCMTKACTLVGCSDSFTATAKRADGTFPVGMHRIEIVADGVTQVCTFTFAGTIPDSAWMVATCSSGAVVMVRNAETCTETRNGNSVSYRCDPIPGQFVETITLASTPAQVHVWQYVDDAAILDAAAAPSYADYFPNGPECGGACRQASASWTLQ